MRCNSGWGDLMIKRTNSPSFTTDTVCVRVLACGNLSLADSLKLSHSHEVITNSVWKTPRSAWCQRPCGKNATLEVMIKNGKNGNKFSGEEVLYIKGSDTFTPAAKVRAFLSKQCVCVCEGVLSCCSTLVSIYLLLQSWTKHWQNYGRDLGPHVKISFGWAHLKTYLSLCFTLLTWNSNMTDLRTLSIWCISIVPYLIFLLNFGGKKVKILSQNSNIFILKWPSASSVVFKFKQISKTGCSEIFYHFSSNIDLNFRFELFVHPWKLAWRVSKVAVSTRKLHFCSRQESAEQWLMSFYTCVVSHLVPCVLWRSEVEWASALLKRGSLRLGGQASGGLANLWVYGDSLLFQGQLTFPHLSCHFPCQHYFRDQPPPPQLQALQNGWQANKHFS